MLTKIDLNQRGKIKLTKIDLKDELGGAVTNGVVGGAEEPLGWESVMERSKMGWESLGSSFSVVETSWSLWVFSDNLGKRGRSK